MISIKPNISTWLESTLSTASDDNSHVKNSSVQTCLGFGQFWLRTWREQQMTSYSCSPMIWGLWYEAHSPPAPLSSAAPVSRYQSSVAVQIAQISVVWQQKSHWPTNGGTCRMIANVQKLFPSLLWGHAANAPSTYQPESRYMIWWASCLLMTKNSNGFQFWRIKYLPLLCGDWQGQWSSLANWLCQLGKWNIWMGRNNTVDSGETKIWIQTNHRYLPMLGADWGQLKKQPILNWAICDLCTAECRVSPIPTGYFLSIGLFLQPIFLIWLQTNRQTQQLNATIVTCRRLPLSLEKSLKA